MQHKNFFALQKSLSKPAAVYFLYGTEHYIESLALKAIRQAVIRHNGEAGLDRLVFFGDEPNWGQCFTNLKTLSLVPQLVILKRAECLKVADWERLAQYCKQPSRRAKFVIVTSKIDKRKKVFSQILACTQHMELKSPNERELPMWLQHILRSLQLSIPPEFEPLLCELLGCNLNHMHNELLKLTNINAPLDKKLLLEHLHCRRMAGVFEFTQALGQKNKARAMVLLDNLLQHGQSELGILALSLRHFRILLATLEARGLQGARLAQYIQVPAFFVQQYVEQARKWSYAELNRSLVYIHEVDKRIKTSPLPARLHLEALVFNL